MHEGSFSRTQLERNESNFRPTRAVPVVCNGVMKTCLVPASEQARKRTKRHWMRLLLIAKNFDKNPLFAFFCWQLKNIFHTSLLELEKTPLMTFS